MNVSTFSALAEPNRLRIIELLREQPCSVNQIAEKLKLRQPQASKHLQTLSKAGLVTVRSVAQQRIYSVRSEPFSDMSEWLKSFEHRWRDRFSDLDTYLAYLKKNDL